MPIGVIGELLLGGAGLSMGYLNRPELNQTKFIPDPFTANGKLYRTGDLVKWSSEGNLVFAGRIDHQVKYLGHRVELDEIETHLMKIEEVKQVVLILSSSTAMLAYIVPELTQAFADLPGLKHKIMHKLHQHLPYYMIPSQWIFTRSFPMTASGKIDKKKLALEEQNLVDGGLAAPATPLEQTIVDIWSLLLKNNRIDREDNFFESGGNSLLLMQVQIALEKRLNKKIPVAVLFQYPVVSDLAEYLVKGVYDLSHKAAFDKRKSAKPCSLWQGYNQTRIQTGSGYSHYWMAGRFPGADNIEQFWNNLCQGIESLAIISGEQLREEGIDESLINHQDYVPVNGLLDNIDKFDAGFFGFNAREAQICDPQQRLLLECSWEAIENAGYNVDELPLTGTFAGVNGDSSYFLHYLYPDKQLREQMGDFQLMLGNDREFAATRIAWKLNLKGPALTIQTGCSTSLSVIATACQNLLTWQCDLALAAAASIRFPQRQGYLFKEGMIMSRDGHCRAFDEKASGTVWGNGVAVVLLKRLDVALKDRDHIYAVIKGFGINNDGADKAGFTAPSIKGQAIAISTAMAMAGFSADSIGYVEAHGTGTLLGDPIEIAALQEAYHTDKTQYCAIGSVKTNIGHLDVAAGLAGLVKTAMAIERAQIPPSLHFSHANPNIDFQESPFYVNTGLQFWLEKPLRAGLSAFGIGGTNVHLVLEEAPLREGATRPAEQLLFLLSAKTQKSLQLQTARLKSFLESNPAVSMPDLAYTLQRGRKFFKRRTFFLAETTEELSKKLEKLPIENKETAKTPEIIFMFPGQRSQYVDMGRHLYQHEPFFKKILDGAMTLFQNYFDIDLKSILFPTTKNRETAALALNETAITQPLLFIMEYAIASLLMEWGILPTPG